MSDRPFGDLLRRADAVTKHPLAKLLTKMAKNASGAIDLDWTWLHSIEPTRSEGIQVTIRPYQQRSLAAFLAGCSGSSLSDICYEVTDGGLSSPANPVWAPTLRASCELPGRKGTTPIRLSLSLVRDRLTVILAGHSGDDEVKVTITGGPGTCYEIRIPERCLLLESPIQEKHLVAALRLFLAHTDKAKSAWTYIEMLSQRWREDVAAVLREAGEDLSGAKAS